LVIVPLVQANARSRDPVAPSAVAAAGVIAEFPEICRWLLTSNAYVGYSPRLPKLVIVYGPAACAKGAAMNRQPVRTQENLIVVLLTVH
jgi:hypothetical protein